MNTTSKDPGQGKANDAVEIGDEIMSEVASNLGSPVTQGKTAGNEDDAGGANDEDEADNESGAESEGGEDDNQNDDQDEGTEESGDEAEGDDDQDDAGEGEDEEPDEEKAQRELADKATGKADKAAAAKKLAAALKGATPEQLAAAQAVVDSLIDEHVVKGRGETERLGARVTELTAELESEKKSKGPAIIGAVNPLFLVDDEAALDDRETKIEEFESWAEEKIAAGGDNLPDTEGYDEKKPSYTAAQIRERLSQVRQEKKKLLPAARANLQKRAAIDKNLREIYPALFDPKSTEYAQVQQVFKALPELKQFADARVIALKQILGDRALADLLAKRKKESSPKGQDGKETKSKGANPPPKKSPPRAPGGGAPAKGGVLDPKSKQTGAPEAVNKVMKNPGDRKAFSDAVAALVTDL